MKKNIKWDRKTKYITILIAATECQLEITILIVTCMQKHLNRLHILLQNIFFLFNRQTGADVFQFARKFEFLLKLLKYKFRKMIK